LGGGGDCQKFLMGDGRERLWKRPHGGKEKEPVMQKQNKREGHPRAIQTKEKGGSKGVTYLLVEKGRRGQLAEEIKERQA